MPARKIICRNSDHDTGQNIPIDGGAFPGTF
jgi:hypothetical protein